MNHTPRRRRRMLGFGLSIIPVLAVVASTNVEAATQTQAMNLNLSGTTGVHNLIETSSAAVCDECIPDDISPLSGWTGVGEDIAVEVKVDWSNDVDLLVSADDSLLEEGSVLDTEDMLIVKPSTIDATVRLVGGIGILNDPDGADNGVTWEPVAGLSFGFDQTFSQTAPCTIPLPGNAPKTCTIEFLSIPTVPIVTIWEVLNIGFDTVLTLDVTVDTDGVITTRSAKLNGGAELGTEQLTFAGTSPSIVADPLAIPCNAAGKTLQYGVDQLDYAADTTLTFDMGVNFKFEVIGIDIVNEPLFSVVNATKAIGDVTLTGAGDTLELGTVAMDTDPPVAVAAGPMVGWEGQPIPFDGSQSEDDCGAPTLTWFFSDGGVAYGTNPEHTFADNGVYSGQLMAVDARGNVGYDSFSVAVLNKAPIAGAGPDTTSLWGLPVAFDGYASDPGAGDLPTLSASWSFGDGTPSASGGADTTHVYAAPGDYVAKLTVCDKDGSCADSERTVHVTKRDTAIAYTGSVSGLPKKSSTLSANVTDELGQPVAGRTVTFTVGTQSVSAVTDVNGTATGTIKISQKTGDYTVTASFAGDAKYAGAGTAADFRIGK